MNTAFTISPEIIDLLGGGYKSAEYAVRELVDNAWDADAHHVWLTIPDASPTDLSQYELKVQDDGIGMQPTEVGSYYLRVANNRHTVRGDFTAAGRTVKGRKGIGKFAGLYVGNIMHLDTRAGGRHTHLEFDKQFLQEAVRHQQELGRIQLSLTEQDCATAEHGTTITIRGLHQTLVQPNVARIKRFLALEYSRAEDFQVYVNGELLDVTAIQGMPFDYADTLPEVGPVRLRFVVSQGKQTLRDPGIGLRVKSKIVGKPGFYGIRESMPELPKQLLRKVYGEVEADDLLDLVTAHWNELPKDTRAFQALTTFVTNKLHLSLQQAFATELTMAKARLQKQINKELEKLPEHKRDFARQAVEKALRKFYDLPSDKLWAIVSVVLDAIERDEYWYVLKTLEEARHSEVGVLAEALNEFGMVELTRTARSAAARLQFLHSLQELAANKATTEQVMHEAFAANLWLLGPDYTAMISNRTLRHTVEKLTGANKYVGPNATKRPDLLLARNYEGRYLLLEFKRPSYTIGYKDVAQAEAYRQELTPHIQSGARIDLLIVGGKQDIPAQYSLSQFTTVDTFDSLIGKAATMLTWLTDELKRD